MIKEVSERTGLTQKAIAEVLFPKHNHPYQALRYLEQGKRELKESEIAKLKELCGEWPLQPNDKPWKAMPADRGFKFGRGMYIVTYLKGTATVLKEDGTVIQANIGVKLEDSITTFFNSINQLIEDYETKH